MLVTIETRSGRSILQVVESTLGVLFAFQLGFVVVVFGGWVVWESRGYPEFPMLVACYVVAAVAEIVFLTWLKASLERQVQPLAPALAMRQPRWPLLVRPLVAAWWSVHFAAAAVALIFAEHQISLDGHELRLTVMLGFLYLGAQFMLTNSAMLYLLLAVASVVPGEKLIQSVWRKRILIDLLAMGAAAVAAFRWQHS